MARYVLPVVVEADDPAAAVEEVRGTLSTYLPDTTDDEAPEVEAVYVGDACSVPTADEYETHMVYLRIGGDVFAAIP